MFTQKRCDRLTKEGYSCICWQGIKGPRPKWVGKGGGGGCPCEIRLWSLWGIAAATGTSWVAGRVRPHHEADIQSLPVRTSIIFSWQYFNASLITLMDTGGGTDNSTAFFNPPETLAQHKQLPLRCPSSETRPSEWGLKESDPRSLVLEALKFFNLLYLWSRDFSIFLIHWLLLGCTVGELSFIRICLLSLCH